ncbi:MAG: 50S ribosomal protein L3 [Deltaproteobacteria bacterium]|nr:50S ribosomal protein L3 [Deltaproteobacteria bacterium]
MKSIVGKKLGMMQEFDEAGRRYALTVVEAQPGVVLRVKASETDGYAAVQGRVFPGRSEKLNRPDAGQFKKHLQSKAGYRVLREFRVDDPAAFKVGQEITVETFAAGDTVDVQGKSIGKGFQGNIKRHHHSRGPMTHGSKNRRESGSIGSATHLARTVPGRKMPGQMGAKTATVQKLTVHRIDAEKSLLFIAGGVPGPKGGTVTVRETTKARRA